MLRPIVIMPTPTPVPSAQPPLPAMPDNKRTRSADTCEEAQSTSSTVGSLSMEHNPSQLTATQQKALMQQEEALPLQTQSTTGPEEKLASPSSHTKLLDFSVLRDCGFICYSLFGLFATLGFFAPQLYVIELSVSRGIQREKAAFMLSTIAISEIFGRMSIGWILNKKPISKIYIMLLCVLLLCVVLVVFTFVTHIWGLTACCVLYGFLFGTVASTHVPMLAEDDVVGVERMSSAAGVYVFIQSFAGLAGPPLGGKHLLKRFFKTSNIAIFVYIFVYTPFLLFFFKQMICYACMHFEDIMPYHMVCSLKTAPSECQFRYFKVSQCWGHS